MRESIMNWDSYFMEIAKLTSQRSKDPSTQVGAVIVRDKRILSTGYNGFPFGIKDNDDRWIKENKDTYVIHAEMNAILSSRQVIAGSTIYVTLFPCRECTKAIIQSGIKEVVYGEYRDKYEDSKRLLVEAGIKIRSLELEFLRVPDGIEPGDTFKILATVESIHCKDNLKGENTKFCKALISTDKQLFFTEDDLMEMTDYDLSVLQNLSRKRLGVPKFNSKNNIITPRLFTIEDINNILRDEYEFCTKKYRAEITLKCMLTDCASNITIDNINEIFYYTDGDKKKQILQKREGSTSLRSFHSYYKDFYVVEDINLMEEIKDDNNSNE